MQIENYNCKKCGLTITSNCSKCNKTVDVEVLDDGCIVQKQSVLIVQMLQLLKIFVHNKIDKNILKN